MLCEGIERLEDLADLQPEFRQLAASLLPLSTATGEELHADPQKGLHTHVLDGADDAFQFSEIFKDQDDDFPQHASIQRQLYVGLVLQAITDEEGVWVIVQGQGGSELGFAAHLQ